MNTTTSTDIRTRRLIVTLPDFAREEADEIARGIENDLTNHYDGRATAEHALDDAPLEGWSARPNKAWVGLVVVESARARDDLTIQEARKLAALLLRAADEAEGRS